MKSRSCQAENVFPTAPPLRRACIALTLSLLLLCCACHFRFPRAALLAPLHIDAAYSRLATYHLHPALHARRASPLPARSRNWPGGTAGRSTRRLRDRSRPWRRGRRRAGRRAGLLQILGTYSLSWAVSTVVCDPLSPTSLLTATHLSVHLYTRILTNRKCLSVYIKSFKFAIFEQYLITCKIQTKPCLGQSPSAPNPPNTKILPSSID